MPFGAKKLSPPPANTGGGALEGAIRGNTVCLRQLWVYEPRWRILCRQNILQLPLGRTVYISPGGSKRVCLPWEIRGSDLTGFFSLLHRRRVSVSSQFSARSGRLHALLFNFGSEVEVVAAKTFVLGVGSRTPLFHVRTTDGREQYLSDGKGIDCGAKSWEVASVGSESKFFAQFPQLFGEQTCEIPRAMRRFEIQWEDISWRGNMRYRGKSAFNVESLVPAHAIDETIAEMVRSGYVEEVESGAQLMLHPVIFLPKSDGRTRLVVDLRRVNGHTGHTRGGLPAIHALFRQIPQDWRYFCKLDLRNGFHRVPLGESMKNIFAFGIRKRYFRYKVLPQGWSASPFLFHAVIMEICAGHPVIHYIDDLLVGARTLRELETRVVALLTTLGTYGLQIQRKKFDFGKTKIGFLGLELAAGGQVSAERYLRERRERMGSVVETKKELQSLLGTLNIARHFVPALSQKTKGLQELLTCLTGDQLQGEERARAHQLTEEAWEEVLGACVSVQMAIPEGAQFELYTDWSTEAMGYVLFARGEAGRQIVDINSALTANQAATSSFLGELRGIAWGLKKTRHIVWTSPIKICCDNQGTVSRLQKGEIMGDDLRCSRLMSWILENFPQAVFEYIPGAINQVADYLSRKRDRRSGTKAVAEVQLDRRPPEEVVQHRLEKAHRGHWHAARTWQHLKRDGPVWPGARGEVFRYVKRCPTCQRFRGLEHREPWTGMATMRPNDVVFGDFLGPITLSRGRGKRVLLVLVDGFSRYTHLHMATTPTEKTVLRGLRRWEQTFVWRHGHIRLFMADRGAAFIGGRVRAFCEDNGIRQQWSASHAPWSNGAAERQVGNVKARLARLLWRSPTDISLSTLEEILNHGVCETTGFTPMELCRGRRRDGSLMSIGEWEQATLLAQARRTRKRSKEEETYLRRYPKKPALRAGQWVLAYEPHRRQHALHSPWTGPHLTAIPRGSKLWELYKDGTPQIIGPFHAEHLRSYHTAT